MKKSALNKNLRAAKANKKDEFYTQLTDIEKELKHYAKYFNGKTVFCNCDDPWVSNFFKFFANKFEQFGLKRLITTCYKNQNPDLFSQHKSEKAIYLEYYGDKDGDRVPSPEEIGVNYLKGDGDFRSPECVELLKQADVLVTNPPFSLFRDYVKLAMKHKKKFIIMGHQNAISYKEIFKLIKENKIWLGVDNFGTKWFGVNDNYDITTESRKKIEGGKKFFSMGSVVWFTNLDIKKRHDSLLLVKKYNPKDYPKYDNYNAINVNKYTDIPVDYDGVMGVPITFIDKYNPEQFEIIGSDYDVKDGLLPNIVKKSWKGKIDRGYINGKRMYARLLIKKK